MDITVGNGDQLNLRATIKVYLELMKLRIVILLCFTTVTAMIIASSVTGSTLSAELLIATILGGIFASGGSSAINQYIDRDMDALMSRTIHRPIPSGRIQPINALIFGSAMIIWSVITLTIYVNPLAALMALIGSLYYVVIYTLILKRNTVVNILIGGGAGAFPVLVGWSAVTGSLGYEAGLLFAIVFWWTPPHSWALALLVNADYTKANVPMMPVARGEETTRIQILLYSTQLLLITLLPSPFGILGAFYFFSAFVLGLGLIWMAIKLIRIPTKAMARQTYKYSTAYLAFLFLAMILDRAFVALIS